MHNPPLRMSSIAPQPTSARPTPADGTRLGVHPLVRVLAVLSVITAAGTYLAAQIDFVRRHTMGFPPISPERYWVPQLLRIWLPGLGAALLLAGAAFALHRRRRAD